MDHHITSTTTRPAARIPAELQALSDTPLLGDPADQLTGSVRDPRVLTTRLAALIPGAYLIEHIPGPDGYPEFEQSAYTLGQLGHTRWHLILCGEDLTAQALRPARLADLEDLARY